MLALAGRALAMSENPGRPGEIAVSRVRSRGGNWVVLHGACLTSAGHQRVAIIIEPAHPERLNPLLLSAYGTEREKAVTRLVLQGQQHLKSIFDETGVHSRRGLVGRVFFNHFEPRFRDNETRALVGKPLRGGPWDSESGGTRIQAPTGEQPR